MSQQRSANVKTRRVIGLIAVVCISRFAACNSISTTDTGKGAFTAGTYTASEKGFGGDVLVTIEVSNNKILKVIATGDKETAGIGSKAIEILPEKILKAQSADIDGVSGATFSSNALLSAAKAALGKARGGSAGNIPVKMEPGTYTGYGQGFRLFEKIAVSVRVDEKSILGIDVSKDNGETKPILQSVVDKMIPRMIERQSINIDGITGATASSNAVRTAVTEALIKALKAGGSPSEAISAFKKSPVKAAGKTKIIDGYPGRGHGRFRHRRRDPCG